MAEDIDGNDLRDALHLWGLTWPEIMRLTACYVRLILLPR
jgi:hypothetical protein